MKLVRTLVALSVSAACANAFALLPAETKVAVGDGARAVATDPLLHRAFVTNHDSGTVSIIDLPHLSTVVSVPAGPNPGPVLSNAASSRLYLLNDLSPGALTVMDAVSGAIIARIAVGDRPQDMAADFHRGEVYVSNSASNSISIVDIVENRVAATLPVGTAPRGLAIDAVRGKVYVANTLDATVSVIDQDSRSPIATVTVGRNPGVPVVDQRSGRVYVNSVDDRTVFVMDGATQAVVATLPSGSGSVSGSLSPIYRKYYLPNATDNSVTVIDLDSISVIGTLRVGRSPQEVSVDADSGAVYVPNRDSHSVSVIDPVDDRAAGALQTGANPTRLAFPAGLNRILVVGDGGNLPGTAAFVTKPRLAAGTAIAAEYYHPGFDHYLHSAAPLEKRLLDDGIYGTAWNGTQTYWRVWTAPGPDRVPMCRFTSFSFGLRSSQLHAYGDECSALKAGGRWDYETIAYFVALPDASGACAAHTEPLYRVYNDSQGGAPNHRYTPDRTIRDGMQAQGWIAEGVGPDRVFACTPALRTASFAPFPLLDSEPPPQDVARSPLGPRPLPK